MTTWWRLAATLVAAVLVVGSAGRAQDRPLPEKEAFFAAVRENLERADKEQDRYAYKERRSDLHVNPFGSRIGTDGSSVYDVTPIAPGIWERRLIERDGKPVTDSKPERQDRRSRRPSSARSPIDDAVQALEFAIDRRESWQGRDAIVVTFLPRRNAKPQTRQGELAVKFQGEVWIDENASEVVRAQATAIDDLSFGWGMVARLNEGTKATLIRDTVKDGIWLPTSLRLVGEGRAMLFRKLTVDYTISWFDYRKVL
jgi:hypothetical protein